METWIIHILNGVSLGMLLFLLASGLTLIFGLMNIVNLSHGGYYLLGAYIACTVMATTKNFLLAIVAGGLSVSIIGLLMERFFLHRLYKKPLAQVLLTIGFTLVFADTTLMIWGGAPHFVDKPEFCVAPIRIGQSGFPRYRLFVILVGIAVGLLLGLFQEKTRAGAMVRAAVNDEEIARALGINVRFLFTAIFTLGAFLAGLSGVLGGPFLGAYPGADFEILLLTVVVIIVGGLGSLRGALVGSLLIGVVDNFGKVFFPQMAMFTIYVPMVIILALKPSGLFGRRVEFY
jgi:branched-chain amino acid transport system permease protein